MNDTITPADLQAKLKEKMDVQLLDVRRKNDLDSDPVLIPGAVWHDPAEASTWADELSSDQEVVIYCARGGSVSKSTMETLRAKGLTVQYVEGGLAGWKESGGELISG
ncbi:MAG: sulfurtransferase [Deltaproteobacteria bacterium]|nr:sulfurtransferase [Deltaproteobacteria bacterium]